VCLLESASVIASACKCSAVEFVLSIEIQYYLRLVLKILQISTPCKDDRSKRAQLKQHISQMIILPKMSVCCENKHRN